MCVFNWNTTKILFGFNDTFCLHGCVVILLACPGSFRHSLVLTSTAEPSGTITTDLASHFQRRNDRPLLSVRAVPSSAWITSQSPPLPLSSPITRNLPLPPSYKKRKQTSQKKEENLTGFFFFFVLFVAFFPGAEFEDRNKGGKNTPHYHPMVACRGDAVTASPVC